MNLYQVGKQFINDVGSAEYQSGSQFINENGGAGGFEVSAASTVTFSHSELLSFPIYVAETVEFNDEIILINTLQPELEQTVTFSHTAVGSPPIKRSLSNNLTFTHSASASLSLPRFIVVPQAFILTQIAFPDYVYVLEQTVVFENVEPESILTRSPVVEHTVSFGHAVAYEGKIDLCRYSPNIGESTIAASPSPPPASITVVKQNFITLSYPTVAPTHSVTIRAPEYGDNHRLNFDRINRESRGGSLQIFSDPTWPKQEILELQFTVLKESEAQAVIDFFYDTLGQEVKLVDWYGRTWHGFVTNPESPIVRSRRGVVDLSFEFEGEQQ